METFPKDLEQEFEVIEKEKENGVGALSHMLYGKICEKENKSKDFWLGSFLSWPPDCTVDSKQFGCFLELP